MRQMLTAEASIAYLAPWEMSVFDKHLGRIVVDLKLFLYRNVKWTETVRESWFVSIDISYLLVCSTCHQRILRPIHVVCHLLLIEALAIFFAPQPIVQSLKQDLSLFFLPSPPTYPSLLLAIAPYKR